MVEKVLIHIPDEMNKTIMSLKNQTLQEDDLVFFSNHTGSKQAWYRYILQMGILKTKEEFENFKLLKKEDKK